MDNIKERELTRLLEKKQKRKARAGGRPKLKNIPRSWLHQGFTYLDTTQRLYRMIFETSFLLVLVWLFAHIFSTNHSNYLLWILSAVITHTIFWVFDSNWWAGILFAFPRIKNAGEQATVDYLNSMAQRLARNKAITGVLVYGSVARGVWHDRSDLDIRYLRGPGIWHGLIAVISFYRERILALLQRQPLDAYIADDTQFLLKMRSDERPVMLKKSDSRLDLLYPDNKPVRFETMTRFRNI